MMFYRMYVALLAALDLVLGAFDVFAGIRPVVFEGEPIMLYDALFTLTPISVVFWGITTIGFALALFFSMIKVAKKAADLNAEKSIGSTLGEIGKTLLMFFITPLMILALLQITALTMQKTDEIFDVANGGMRADTTIFALTARNAALENPAVIIDFATEKLSYFDESVVTRELDIDRILTPLGIFLAASMTIAYFLILLVLILRVFMLILLYVVSPLFVSSMVLDGGEKYKAWRRAVFGKLISGFALLVSVKIITYILIPFLISDIVIVPDVVGDVVLKCFLLFGSCYGAYKSMNMIVKIVAPGIDSEDMLVLGMAVGMSVGLGKAAFKAAYKIPAAMLTGGINLAKDLVKEATKTIAQEVGKNLVGFIAKSAGTAGFGLIPAAIWHVGKGVVKGVGKLAIKAPMITAKNISKTTKQIAKETAKNTIKEVSESMSAAKTDEHGGTAFSPADGSGGAGAAGGGGGGGGGE